VEAYDKNSVDLTPEQVAAYLRLHPDFFSKRPDLL